MSAQAAVADPLRCGVALIERFTGNRVEPPAAASAQDWVEILVSRLAATEACALASHDVVVVPGFLACGPDSTVVTLGRGGSDLSAVAIATALRADRCELIQDVPGYFTADPHRNAHAEHLAIIDYKRAEAMAREGCGLVQAAALEAARRANLTLIIRAADDRDFKAPTPPRTRLHTCK